MKRKVLAELAQAERLRARAIQRLAAVGVGAGDGFVFGAALAALLRRRRARLEASHGYLGHALGWKLRGGHATAELAVTVFVTSKLAPARLARARGRAVPSRLTLSPGTTLATDVVELGALEPQAIRPGASIGPRSKANPGTLTCFAWNAAHQLVGLTAGHVATGATQYVTPAKAGAVFGSLERERSSPVDAASILITSPSSHVLPDGSRIIGARALTEFDVGTSVSVYGARTGHWSAGSIKYLVPWVAPWGLADVVLYSAPTAKGDSGGPVIDQQGHLIGLHVGRATYQGKPVAVASAITRVATELTVTPTF